MRELISKLGEEKLKQFITYSFLESIKRIIPNKDVSLEDDLHLADCLLAKYGFEILNQKHIREALFMLLDNDTLSDLCNKYVSKKYTLEGKTSKAYYLSKLPWRFNSSFLFEVSKLLKISDEYLPNKTNNNTATEFIEPEDNIPKLFEYQLDLKNQIIDEIQNSTKRFAIQLPTGSGKTRVLIEALTAILNKDFNRTVIWLAHSEELCEQAIDTLKNVWLAKGGSALRLVRLWGTYNPSEFDLSKSFIFATLQKMVSLKSKGPKGSNIYDIVKKNVSIIVIDEAHKAIAKTYKDLLNDLADDSIKKSTLIGATATPGRTSSNNTSGNLELALFFNKKLLVPAMLKDDPVKYLRDINVLSTLSINFVESGVNVSLDEKEFNEDTSPLDSSRIIKKLSMNTKRNKVILKSIEDEINSGNPCLVFSCSVEHSVILSSLLSLMGIKAHYVDCHMRKGYRRKIIDDFKDGKFDVLLNFGVLSTGFDAPRIKAVIITRPTGSVVLYSQMIGRGLRGKAMGGSSDCKLIDIKDNFINYGDVDKVYQYFDEYWK